MQPYDQSEKNLIESIESGEWKSAHDAVSLAGHLQIYAREELKRKSTGKPRDI